MASVEDGTYDTVVNMTNLVSSALSSSNVQNNHNHPITTITDIASTPVLPPRSPTAAVADSAVDADVVSSPSISDPQTAAVLRRQPITDNRSPQFAFNETGVWHDREKPSLYIVLLFYYGFTSYLILCFYLRQV